MAVAIDHGRAQRMIFMTGGPFGARLRELVAGIPNARINKAFDVEELVLLLQRARARLTDRKR